VQVKNKRVGGTDHVFILASVESTVSNIYTAADLLPKSSSSLCTVTVAELAESDLLPTTFALCFFVLVPLSNAQSSFAFPRTLG
jgi:hypothetical protein